MSLSGGRPTAPPTPRSSPRVDMVLRRKVKDAERKMHRLEIVNQALWELARDALGLNDEQLDAKIKEIDLRDGVEDDKISEVPLRCPSCGRVSSSKFWKCLYCGMEFEKEVIG